MVKHDRAVTANASVPPVGDVSDRRIYIEDVYPLVDGGPLPVKRVAGEPVDVWADIFRDGHAVLAADLLWRVGSLQAVVARSPCELDGNDRWTVSFMPPEPGRYVYAIEAWTDQFATWRRDFLAKREAGMDVSLEIEEGRHLLAALLPRDEAEARLIRDLRYRHAGR